MSFYKSFCLSSGMFLTVSIYLCFPVSNSSPYHSVQPHFVKVTHMHLPKAHLQSQLGPFASISPLWWNFISPSNPRPQSPPSEQSVMNVLQMSTPFSPSHFQDSSVCFRPLCPWLDLNNDPKVGNHSLERHKILSVLYGHTHPIKLYFIFSSVFQEFLGKKYVCT